MGRYAASTHRARFLGLSLLLACPPPASAQVLVGGNLPMTSAAGFQSAPTIVANPAAGEFVVFWHDLRSGYSYDVFGPRVGTGESLVGSEFFVATGAGGSDVAFNSVSWAATSIPAT